MNDTAWLYLVVSTSRQAETLIDQKAWATSAAMAAGWTISRTFQGSASGKNGPRKLIQDLLAELRLVPASARPTRILMTRLDRVGRGDTLQLLVAIDEIMRLGVIIHTREDGDLIIRKSSDIIKPFFRALTGGMENEARADKSRAGHARRRAAGLHNGNVPYGVVLIGGRPRPCEPAATVVRKIFALRAQGVGLRRIAKLVIQENPPPKILKHGRTMDLLWDKSTIALMLKCTTYRDLIVDKDLFDAASVVHSPEPKFTKSGKGVWPLSGAVLCSCGRKLSGRMSGKAPWRHRYYVCYEHVDSKQPHFRADAIEAAFTEILGQLIASPELQKAYRSPRAFAGGMRERVSELERALVDLQNRRRNILAHAELLPPTAESSAVLSEHLSDLGARTIRLEADLRNAKSDLAQAETLRRQAANAAELLDALPKIWPTLAPKDQRDVARFLSNMLGGIRLEKGCTSQNVSFAPPPESLESVYVCFVT